MPGKGGITAATASGVWACDFNGALRLLFRTGDVIDGKTLKSFTLLKATVGNMGVTRSFNDAAQVVWLATFTDKVQAIITTEVSQGEVWRIARHGAPNRCKILYHRHPAGSGASRRSG